MTSLELLQEIDAWLSFNNSPSKEQISELRNDIKNHISEQLNILHVSVSLPDDYDSGLLNDYGCGNVEWWQDYIREEVARCNGYWRDYLEGSQGNER